MTFGQGTCILLHVLQKYKILPKRRGENSQKIVTLKGNDRNREGYVYITCFDVHVAQCT